MKLRDRQRQHRTASASRTHRRTLHGHDLRVARGHRHQRVGQRAQDCDAMLGGDECGLRRVRSESHVAQIAVELAPHAVGNKDAQGFVRWLRAEADGATGTSAR